MGGHCSGDDIIILTAELHCTQVMVFFFMQGKHRRTSVLYGDQDPTMKAAAVRAEEAKEKVHKLVAGALIISSVY